MALSGRLYRGGRLFDGARFVAATDLRVAADGRIAELGAGLRPAPGEEVLELDGRWLLPGLVDCHVHFREPGLERKEGYATGSLGALHGGVTTVLEIQNNPPLLTSRALLDAKLAGRAGVSRVDYGAYGNLIEEALAELPRIAARVPAFKCFLGCSTGMGGVHDRASLRRLFQAAADAGARIVAHCEDDAVLAAAAAALRGPEAERHDRNRPPEAELASIDTALEVAAETGADLHVFHVSTAEGARRVAAAAARGQRASSSTAPHYLLWTGDDAAAMPQNRLKVNPSIKSAADRAGLVELLAQGRIACVGTDHAPHPRSEKDRPYRHAPSGFPSVDLLLPLMLAVVDRAGLPLERALAAVTGDAAAEFGLLRKGRLVPGADADLLVVDPNATAAVDEARLPSKSKWSPYHGWYLRGFPQRVFLRGEEVFRDGAACGPPRGRALF